MRTEGQQTAGWGFYGGRLSILLHGSVCKEGIIFDPRLGFIMGEAIKRIYLVIKKQLIAKNDYKEVLDETQI